MIYNLWVQNMVTATFALSNVVTHTKHQIHLPGLIQTPHTGRPIDTNLLTGVTRSVVGADVWASTQSCAGHCGILGVLQLREAWVLARALCLRGMHLFGVRNEGLSSFYGCETGDWGSMVLDCLIDREFKQEAQRDKSLTLFFYGCHRLPSHT